MVSLERYYREEQEYVSFFFRWDQEVINIVDLKYIPQKRPQKKTPFFLEDFIYQPTSGSNFAWRKHLIKCVVSYESWRRKEKYNVKHAYHQTPSGVDK